MPALDQNGRDTCGKYGTLGTKKHLSRHKISFSAGTLFCSKCPNFFTKTRDDLTYQIAKKHQVPRPSIFLQI